MNPLHAESSPNPLPEPAVPAPQRDWRNMTRTIAHYERIEQIGEGTYGQVYRARCKDTNQIVALKKIRVHHGGYWGMPPTVIREIKILKRLRHPSLVQMVEVVSSKGVEHMDEEDEVEEKHKLSKKDRIIDAREGYKGNLFLVLEYVSHDLTGLMDVAFRFNEVQVKSVFKQLLEALQYMHDNKYVHRDIKSSNILIDHNFRVKLADFGLARCIEPPILDKIHDRGSSQEFTNKVITLWYRPPELLLGATRYGTAVDIWSAGCILAELILGKPAFTGKTEMDQLQLIFEMLGTPTPETWDGYQDLKLLRTGEVKIEKKRRPKLREKYQSKMSGPALNLVEKLLELDPQKRLTASRALNSRYFLSDPKAPDQPEELGPLLVQGGHFHEFQTKKKRREAKGIAEKARQNALELGGSEKKAQEEFDATYREIMEKVAKEGLQAGPSKKDKKERPSREVAAVEEKIRREKSERKRSAREKDRELRREKSSGGEKRREDRKRESREKDREKDRPSRDDEKRRKRRRDGESRKNGDSEKSVDAKVERKKDSKQHEETRNGSDSHKTGENAEIEIDQDLDEVEPPEGKKAGDPKSGEKAGDPKSLPEQKGEPKDGVFSPPSDKQPGFDEDHDDRRSKSSRRRHRSRSRDRERRSSRDGEPRSSRDSERRKSRDGDRDRDRDRDRKGRRDDRDRKRDRRDNDHEGGRERDHVGEWGRDKDREPDWGRRDRDRDRGGRDRGPPRGDHRDDLGPRGGPSGPGPYGPSRSGGPPPPNHRGGGPPRDMGIYGPASGDFRGPPPGGQGPPPGYFDDQRRRERERSPRQDRGRR